MGGAGCCDNKAFGVPCSDCAFGEEAKAGETAGWRDEPPGARGRSRGARPESGCAALGDTPCCRSAEHLVLRSDARSRTSASRQDVLLDRSHAAGFGVSAEHQLERRVHLTVIESERVVVRSMEFVRAAARIRVPDGASENLDQWATAMTVGGALQELIGSVPKKLQHPRLMTALSGPLGGQRFASSGIRDPLEALEAAVDLGASVIETCTHEPVPERVSTIGFSGPVGAGPWPFAVAGSLWAGGQNSHQKVLECWDVPQIHHCVTLSGCLMFGKICFPEFIIGHPDGVKMTCECQKRPPWVRPIEGPDVVPAPPPRWGDVLERVWEKIKRWWEDIPDWVKWLSAAAILALILVAFPAAAAFIVQIAARLGLAASATASAAV